MAGTVRALDQGDMPSIATKYFGHMEYDEALCFEFPWGLPAFDEERCFLPLEMPDHEPLLFLQSAANPDLCFIALPVMVVDTAYRLAMSAEDLAALELNTDRQPEIGTEVMVLALLTIYEDAPATANLLAPVVVNLATRRAVQAIRHDQVYSHAQPLAPLSKECTC